jgi:hypothetical protein
VLHQKVDHYRLPVCHKKWTKKPKDCLDMPQEAYVQWGYPIYSIAPPTGCFVKKLNQNFMIFKNCSNNSYILESYQNFSMLCTNNVMAPLAA